MDIRSLALQAFSTANPQGKVAATLALFDASESVAPDATAILAAAHPPGRPEQPILVDPKTVPKRSPYTAEGHASLMHAITHIEFNAINLALDAVWRFDAMPEAYYRDWLRVAAEEAQHFAMLNQHLADIGYPYGHFTAHDGLWTMCERTSHSVLARMALVPRTLEARGLDATPIIQAKLRKVGTPNAISAVALLDRILHDEIGHVAIGNHWYHWLCQRDAVDPLAYYPDAVLRYDAPRSKPPYNLLARRQAGFTPAEIEALTGS